MEVDEIMVRQTIRKLKTYQNKKSSAHEGMPAVLANIKVEKITMSTISRLNENILRSIIEEEAGVGTYFLNFQIEIHNTYTLSTQLCHLGEL